MNESLQHDIDTMLDHLRAAIFADPDPDDEIVAILFTEKGDAIIPRELVARWKLQAATPYAELSEREKQSDRDEVAHILPIIQAWRKAHDLPNDAA